MAREYIRNQEKKDEHYYDQLNLTAGTAFRQRQLLASLRG